MARCFASLPHALAALLLFLTPAFAEEEGVPVPASEDPIISGISYVSITVDDQDKALAWYIEALDVAVTMDEPYGANGERWLSVVFAGQYADQYPQLVLFKPDHAMEKQAGIPETMPATNILFNTNDCVGMTAKLKAAGATIFQEATDKGYGIESVWVDPFGNWFTMVQSTWSAEDDPAVDPG